MRAAGGVLAVCGGGGRGSLCSAAGPARGLLPAGGGEARETGRRRPATACEAARAGEHHPQPDPVPPSKEAACAA